MDRFKGTVSYVPPEVETEAERKDFLCGQDVSLAPQPDHKMKLSQNYGQIVYDLKPTEELIFLVEFNTGNRADCKFRV